jgi:hypothetical protein
LITVLVASVVAAAGLCRTNKVRIIRKVEHKRGKATLRIMRYLQVW